MLGKSLKGILFKKIFFFFLKRQYQQGIGEMGLFKCFLTEIIMAGSFGIFTSNL